MFGYAAFAQAPFTTLGTSAQLYNVVVAEALTSADTSSTVVAFAGVVSEALTSVDLQSTTAAFVSTTTEALTTTDLPTITASFLSAQIESLTSADLQSVTTAFVGSVSETITSADLSNTVTAFTGSVVESINVNLIATRTATIFGGSAFGEGAFAGEAISAFYYQEASATVALGGNVTEAITVADSPTAVYSTSGAVTEVLALETPQLVIKERITITNAN